MLNVFGLGLTALGTILAIVKPSTAGTWGGNDTPKLVM